MEIDASVADVLGLSADAPEADVAAQLARLAKANPPTTPAAISLWIELERAIERVLDMSPRPLDNYEAASSVVSDVEERTSADWDSWVQAFASEGSGGFLDDNPDERLRILVAEVILPPLGESGRISLR